MTIIAAAEDKSGYWIGSDSHGIVHNISVELGPKLIKKEKYVIGFSNSYRVRDIITENKHFPKTIGSTTSLRKFRDVLKEAMVNDGCMPVGMDGDTVLHPVSLVIISHNGIYTIDCDYQMHKAKQYTTIGAGSDVALGALRATLNISKSGAEAVKQAVEAAIFHSTKCSGNIHIEHIPRKR